MLTRVLAVGAMVLFAAGPASAQLDKLLKGLPAPSGGLPASGLSDAKIASAPKEALQIGTENTVKLTGRPDG